MLIDDLSREFPETAIGSRWQLLSDGVMGGVSSGTMRRDLVDGRHAVRMQGNVSLENNGGFLQIALDLAPPGQTMDASAFTGIAIDVLGNDEEYGLHLRTSDLARPWQSYRQNFIATAQWQERRLPFAGFAAHRTEIPLDSHHIRRLGVVAIGRAFQADICICSVRFY